MRKFLMAVAMVGLAIAVATPAMALDFKFGAEYRVRFYDYNNINFDNSNQLYRGSPHGVQIRVRPRFDVSDDNGNIAATLRLEWGDTNFGAGGGANGSSWGTNDPGDIVGAPAGNRVGNGSGGSIGGDGVGVEVKWAFIDFAIPNVPLRIRAGLQPWYLPKGLVIDDDATGIRAYGNYGNFNYEAFWYRIATTPTSVPPAGAAGTPGFVDTKDNNFDFFGAKLGYNFAEWLNASAWYMYGSNHANCTNPTYTVVGGVVTQVGATTGSYLTSCPGQEVNRSQNWFGVDLTGKVKTIEYDLDFAYGQAKGGSNGTYVFNSINTAANPALPALAANTAIDVKGWAIDGGVHIPIGPLKLNLLGTYASGDEGNNDGSDSNAFPLGPGPSWSGAGGQYELIGEGGAFDVKSFTQHGPTGLYMLGFSLEYVPVKALWLKAWYGFAGFTGKWGNCAWAYSSVPSAAGSANPQTLVQNPNTTCYGPTYFGKPSDSMVGESYLGNEFGIRADYTMWTGFKVQGMAGWLVPSAGDVASKYIIQLLYNF